MWAQGSNRQDNPGAENSNKEEEQDLGNVSTEAVIDQGTHDQKIECTAPKYSLCTKDC